MAAGGEMVYWKQALRLWDAKKCNDQPLVAKPIRSIRCPHMASVYLRPVRVLRKRLLVAASMATSGYFAIKTVGSWLKLDSVDVISTLLCLILCCWHWGGCKLCVNMSSLCMNTCFGASHKNYGDRQQILVCFVLWVGVLGGTGRLGIP